MLNKKNTRTWHNLFYKNIDFLIALLLTLLIVLVKLIFSLELALDYTILIAIFIGIFTVNFTVFALSTFLVKNYTKIKRDDIKENIDSIFRAPVKSSIIGAIATLIFMTLKFTQGIYFLYFLVFYGLISSYYVFDFVYTLSVRIKKKE